MKKITFIYIFIILCFPFINIVNADDNILWENELDNLEGIYTEGNNVAVRLWHERISGFACLKITFNNPVINVDKVYFNISDIIVSGSPPTYDLPILNYWIKSDDFNGLIFRCYYKESDSVNVYLSRKWNEQKHYLSIHFPDVTIGKLTMSIENNKWNNLQFRPVLCSPSGGMAHYDVAVNETYFGFCSSTSNAVGGKQYMFEITSSVSGVVYLDYITLRENYEFTIPKTTESFAWSWLKWVLLLIVFIIIFAFAVYVKGGK